MDGHDDDSLLVTIKATGFVVACQLLLLADPRCGCRRRQPSFTGRNMRLLCHLT